MPRVTSIASIRPPLLRGDGALAVARGGAVHQQESPSQLLPVVAFGGLRGGGGSSC